MGLYPQFLILFGLSPVHTVFIIFIMIFQLTALLWHGNYFTYVEWQSHP